MSVCMALVHFRMKESIPSLERGIAYATSMAPAILTRNEPLGSGTSLEEVGVHLCKLFLGGHVVEVLRGGGEGLVGQHVGARDKEVPAGTVANCNPGGGQEEQDVEGTSERLAAAG